MLNPNERNVYLGAFRPPGNYIFDKGIGTTFSLDLMSLLAVPVSLTLFQPENGEDLPPNAITTLEALRRIADRLLVFCQKGKIAVPKKDSLLYGYLEKNVVEVNPRGKGVFHPKFWLLRYICRGKPAMYRLICLSRNISLDRSWDTILVLDGKVTDVEYSENEGILEFIRTLPDLSTIKIDESIDGIMEDIIDEIPRVRFEAPMGFDKSMEFCGLGIGKTTRLPFDMNYDRALIMSPFLAGRLLKSFNKKRDNILISTMDSMDSIEENVLDIFKEKFVIDEGDMGIDDEKGDTIGLHAKLYILEKGNKATIWTGSANASNAAFNGSNVEFMVGLTGDRDKVGIESFLNEDSGDSFNSFLQPYGGLGSAEVDSVEKELEDRLERVRGAIIDGELLLKVSKADKDKGYDMTLLNSRELECDLKDIEIRVWPISQSFQFAKPFIGDVRGKGVLFPNVSLVGISKFIAFKLTGKSNGLKREINFVLNVPMEGLPVDRDNSILKSIISDTGSFLQYILFLLADEEQPTPIHDILPRAINGGGACAGNQFNPIPLTEELVRALSREPEKIDQIFHLVEELKKDEDGKGILPQGFETIWDPIWRARKMVRSR